MVVGVDFKFVAHRIRRFLHAGAEGHAVPGCRPVPVPGCRPVLLPGCRPVVPVASFPLRRRRVELRLHLLFREARHRLGLRVPRAHAEVRSVGGATFGRVHRAGLAVEQDQLTVNHDALHVEHAVVDARCLCGFWRRHRDAFVGVGAVVIARADAVVPVLREPFALLPASLEPRAFRRGLLGSALRSLAASTGRGGGGRRIPVRICDPLRLARGGTGDGLLRLRVGVVEPIEIVVAHRARLSVFTPWRPLYAPRRVERAVSENITAVRDGRRSATRRSHLLPSLVTAPQLASRRLRANS